MPGIVNYSSVVILVSPFMPISVDQIPRIHWIADVIIYIFAVRRNRYRCCLCLVLIHWFTNLLHLHTVLTCILNFHEDISKYCLISLKLKKQPQTLVLMWNVSLLAATAPSLSLVNEAQYLMINSASVQLIQELMSSRYKHTYLHLKSIWECHKDACIFTLCSVICVK